MGSRWTSASCASDKGCRDVGPLWPWLRTDHEKPGTEGGEPMDDAFLLHGLQHDEPGGPALRED